ncbi:hypothetical protein AKO1_000741, partial [Acrasis kona]
MVASIEAHIESAKTECDTVIAPFYIVLHCNYPACLPKQIENDLTVLLGLKEHLHCYWDSSKFLYNIPSEHDNKLWFEIIKNTIQNNSNEIINIIRKLLQYRISQKTNISVTTDNKVETLKDDGERLNKILNFVNN